MYQYTDADDDRSSRQIELSRQDLKDAARLLSLILEAPPASALTPAQLSTMPQKPATSPSPSHEQLLQLATWMFHSRKRRNEFFHPGLFGEAAWDVMLALYIMDQGRPRHSIAEISRVAGVPTATMLRWLQTLEDQGLTCRQRHPHDRRSAMVGLAAKGRDAIETYLSETLKSST